VLAVANNKEIDDVLTEISNMVYNETRDLHYIELLDDKIDSSNRKYLVQSFIDNKDRLLKRIGVFSAR